MESESIYRCILGLLLIAFPLHRGWQTRRRKPQTNRVEAELKTRGASLIGLLGLVALVASATYIVLPTWLAWASLPLPHWLRWAGIVLALAGFGLLEWAQSALAGNWSDTPVKLRDHTLSTSGPYAWVRHPIYTGFLLILSAPLFISANWLVGGAWIAMTYLDVSARAAAEEQMLQATFGPEFDAYRSRTGRFFPRLLRNP